MDSDIDSPATGRHIRSPWPLRSGGHGLNAKHEKSEHRRCDISVPLQDNHTIFTHNLFYWIRGLLKSY